MKFYSFDILPTIYVILLVFLFNSDYICSEFYIICSILSCKFNRTSIYYLGFCEDVSCKDFPIITIFSWIVNYLFGLSTNCSRTESNYSLIICYSIFWRSSNSFYLISIVFFMFVIIWDAFRSIDSLPSFEISTMFVGLFSCWWRKLFILFNFDFNSDTYFYFA